MLIIRSAFPSGMPGEVLSATGDLYAGMGRIVPRENRKMSRSERKKKKKTERSHLSKYQRKVLDRQHSGEAEALKKEIEADREKQVRQMMTLKENQVMDPY
jgi:hypothetical protein